MTAAKRRIGINLCSVRPNQLSGPSVYAERLIDRLLDYRDLDWWIYCHSGLDIPASWNERATVRRVLETIRRPMRVAFEQLRLPLLTHRDRIDLLFSPNFVSPVWGARRLVVTIHDMYYRVIPHVLPDWQRRYWHTFIPFSTRFCDRVLAVSQSTARDIARYLPGAKQKTRVTHLACAVEDPDAPGEPMSGIEPGFVLWVANVVGNKNPGAVTGAAAQLASIGRRMQFVHVGTDDHGLMDAAIAEAGCGSLFQRLGRVSSANLRWLYRNALCVVQPSFYEGFGIPVLEAQAFGAPLICSNAGPLPEVAGDGALYFDPRDPIALADLIIRMADDPALRAAISARGRANTARFTWHETAERTVEVFRELLENTRSDVR